MGRKTILVVDDERKQRQIIRGWLTGHGYAVIEASNCHEALLVEAGHGEMIALLLTDLVLPDGNGYELSKTLREREPDLKVLFVSGQAGAELRKFLDEPLPDVHFLRKPFPPEDLLSRVEILLSSIDPLTDAALKS